MAPRARIDDIFTPSEGLYYSDILNDWIEPAIYTLPEMENVSFRLFTTLEVGGKQQALDINFVSKGISPEGK